MYEKNFVAGLFGKLFVERMSDTFAALYRNACGFVYNDDFFVFVYNGDRIHFDNYRRGAVK